MSGKSEKGRKNTGHAGIMAESVGQGDEGFGMGWQKVSGFFPIFGFNSWKMAVLMMSESFFQKSLAYGLVMQKSAIFWLLENVLENS
jgi:hypothetical protein